MSGFQPRPLVTICEDAFLSLTDFQKSPAEYLFFPKVDNGEEKARKTEIWLRSDYELLSEKEINEAVQIFLASREEAPKILTAERELAKKEIEHRVEATERPARRHMFGPED